MANLGDVNFRLRSDTEGFTRGMLNAARSIDTLERDARQLQTDFRAGRVHIDEYRRSMAALNDQARAVRTGIGQIAFNDLPRLKNILQQTAPQAEKVGLSMRSLRGPLATVAAQAVGVNGSLGSLGSILLSLGTGGTVGLAAIAGIGAIAFAIRKLTADTSEARKEYEEWQKSLQKNSDFAKVGNALEEQQEKVNKLTKQLQAAIRVDPLSMYTQNLKESLGEAVTELGRLQTQERQLFESSTKHDVAESLPKALAIDWYLVENAIRDADFAIKDVLANGYRLGRNEGPLQGFGGGASAAEQAAMQAAAAAKTGFISGIEGATGNKGGWISEEDKESARKSAERLGQSMARSLAAGFTASGGGIGSAIKNVFRSALETVIEALIQPFLSQLAAAVLGALGKGTGGRFGVKDIIGAGIGIGVGVITGGIFSRSSEVAITVPASRSPMDQARDAWWIATMSETMRTLRATNSLRVVPG